MIYLPYFLYLLIVGICTAEAEKLSSGEDVTSFVERHIQGYEVCCFALWILFLLAYPYLYACDLHISVLLFTSGHGLCQELLPLLQANKSPLDEMGRFNRYAYT